MIFADLIDGGPPRLILSGSASDRLCATSSDMFDKSNPEVEIRITVENIRCVKKA